MVNRLCVRNGNEVFVADRNTIEASLLNTSVSAVLDLPLIDQDIVELVLNNSGTFLAVVCTTKVFSVSLPPSGFLERRRAKILNQSQNENTSKSIPLEYQQVGCLQYSQKIQILKAVWNPIAKYDFNLVILSSDAVIRSFELALSHSVPADSFILQGNDANDNNKAQPQLQQDNSFSLNAVNTIQTPVSIAFGSENLNDPIGCLSLYIFTREGDLYTLFPFHPVEISVPQKFVDLLFNHTSILYRDTNHKYNAFDQALDDPGLDEDEPARDEVEEKLTKLRFQKLAISVQLFWISKLSKQVIACNKEYKYANNSDILEEFSILSPPSRINRLKLQGPLTLNNLPSSLDGDYAVTGNDIISVNNGDVNLLNIAFDNGDLLTLIQENNLLMRWSVEPDFAPESESEQEPQRTLLASGTFSSSDQDSAETPDEDEGEGENDFGDYDEDEIDYYLTPSCVVLQNIKLTPTPSINVFNDSNKKASKLDIVLVATKVPCLFFVLVSAGLLGSGKQYILKIDFFQWGKELNDMIVDNVNRNNDFETIVSEFFKVQKVRNNLKIDKLYERLSLPRVNIIGVGVTLDDNNNSLVLYKIKENRRIISKTANVDDARVSGVSSQSGVLVNKNNKDDKKNKETEERALEVALHDPNTKIKFDLFQRQFQDNNLTINNFVNELNSDPLVQQFSRMNIREAQPDPNNKLSYEVEEFNANLIQVMEAISGKFIENIIFLTRYQTDLAFNLGVFKNELEYQLVKLNEVVEIIKRLATVNNLQLGSESKGGKENNNDNSKAHERLTNIVNRQSKLQEKFESISKKLQGVKTKQEKTRQNPLGVHNNNLPISSLERKFFEELRSLSSRSNKLRMNYNNVRKQVEFYRSYSRSQQQQQTDGKNGSGKQGAALDERQVKLLMSKLAQEGQLINFSKDAIKQALEDIERSG